MTIYYIKKKISDFLGKKIKILYFGSRNKNEEYVGLIRELYGNIFIVILDSGEVKSFSYADVLTGTLVIKEL